LRHLLFAAHSPPGPCLPAGIHLHLPDDLALLPGRGLLHFRQELAGVAGRPEQLLLPQRTQPVFRAGSPVALAAAYLVAGGGRAVLSLLAPAHAAELANPEDALGALAFCGPLAGRFRPFHPSGEPFGGGSLLPASGTYLRVAAGRSDRVVRR